MNFDLIKALVDPRENQIIFELGANDGVDALNLMNIFPNCRYYGFEPDPHNLNLLKNKTLPKNAKIIPKAIDKEVGVKSFYKSKADWYGNITYGTSGSLLKPTEHLNVFPHVTFEEKTEVETITIEKFCQEEGIDHIDFIWMDIQGSEADAIKGCGDFLNKIHYIYTDIYPGDPLYEGACSIDEFKNLLGINWKEIYRLLPDLIYKNTIFK